jgi:hypothetical protein
MLELADEQLIGALTRTKRPGHARPPQRVFEMEAKPTTKVRRCKCEMCKTCVENAR